MEAAPVVVVSEEVAPEAVASEVEPHVEAVPAAEAAEAPAVAHQTDIHINIIHNEKDQNLISRHHGPYLQHSFCTVL